MVIWETQEPGQMGTKIKRLSKGCCAELTDRHPNILQNQGQGANLTPLNSSSHPYLFLNTSHLQ